MEIERKNRLVWDWDLRAGAGCGIYFPYRPILDFYYLPEQTNNTYKSVFYCCYFQPENAQQMMLENEKKIAILVAEQTRLTAAMATTNNTPAEQVGWVFGFGFGLGNLVKSHMK
jgi:hypothetical protein